MRQSLAGLAIVVALAAAPALAATPAAAPPARTPAVPAAPPPVGPRTAAAQVPDPVLVFYPVAARTGGIEGSAVIKCVRDEHLALKNCALVSETPAGQGFGAAAMAMAAQSPENAKVDDPKEAAAPPVEVQVSFALHPPRIQPDLTSTAHKITKPAIVTAPNRTQIQAAYPERAFSDQIEGAAAIDCMVTADGKLTRCAIAGEAPGGYGFGQATLDLAADFVMKPRTVDDQPVDGAMVRVGVEFTTNDPAAPLTLGVKPAKP